MPPKTTQEVPGIGTLTLTPKTIAPAGPTQYTVKEGDNLNAIAAAHGFKNYQEAGITGYGDNPDLIKPGQVLSITGKSAVGDNAGGLYARTGVNPPEQPLTDKTLGNPPAGWDAKTYANFKAANPTLEPTPEDTAKMLGLPSYSSGVDSNGSVAAIRKAHQDTVDAITALEGKLTSAAASSPEEQALQKQLVAKKDQLKSFDLESLQASEDLTGQGRGATTSTIGRQDQKLQRTRSLERLGLAQEADTLTNQLSLAQDARKQQGEIAKTEYDLATKKLDIALGVETKIAALNEKEKDNARQYLLDLVGHFDGKTYDNLDQPTKDAITHAVANSPITLDMVKTALKTSAEKTAAAAKGDLRSVPGVGVVMIKPDGSGYSVVVPENPGDHTPPPGNTAPSFNDYLAAQNLPLPSLTPEKLTAIHSEYDAKYGVGSTGTDVNLGKLTASNKNDLSQAGLSTAPSGVKSYFLNAPAAFRDQYQRDVASGKAKPGSSLNDMVAAYTVWYDANRAKSSGSGTDWAAILGAPKK